MYISRFYSMPFPRSSFPLCILGYRISLHICVCMQGEC